MTTQSMINMSAFQTGVMLGRLIGKCEIIEKDLHLLMDMHLKIKEIGKQSRNSVEFWIKK